MQSVTNGLQKGVPEASVRPNVNFISNMARHIAMCPGITLVKGLATATSLCVSCVYVEAVIHKRASSSFQIFPTFPPLSLPFHLPNIRPLGYSIGRQWRSSLLRIFLSLGMGWHVLVSCLV